MIRHTLNIRVSAGGERTVELNASGPLHEIDAETNRWQALVCNLDLVTERDSLDLQTVVVGFSRSRKEGAAAIAAAWQAEVAQLQSLLASADCLARSSNGRYTADELRQQIRDGTFR